MVLLSAGLRLLRNQDRPRYRGAVSASHANEENGIDTFSHRLTAVFVYYIQIGFRNYDKSVETGYDWLCFDYVNRGVESSPILF